MFRLRACLLSILFMACLLPAPASAAEGEPLRLYFQAAITIEPDGSLSRLDWANGDKIPAVLRDRLDARARSWAYEPGAVAGGPARTESTLLLTLLAESRDGGLVVRVENAQTGADMAPMMPPGYPHSALRSGDEAAILANLLIDADGTRHFTVAGYQGDKRHRKAFESAVEAMLAETEYQPERVDGHPVPAEFSVPVTFCMGSGWCDDPEWPERATASGGPPATAPGSPSPVGSVARLLTDVRGTTI